MASCMRGLFTEEPAAAYVSLTANICEKPKCTHCAHGENPNKAFKTLSAPIVLTAKSQQV